MGDSANDEQGHASAPNPIRKRQRSPLAFPYSDLQRAIDLTDKLVSLGGSAPVELTQLAAGLNQTAEGGTFRGRIGAARLFGLADFNTETARITELGKAILDPVTAASAKVDAFLRVPLYAKLYEHYQGYPLPPAAAIERQLTMMGLPQKQVERARQVFAASVDTAGFLNGNGRFVKPVVSARSDPTRAADDADKQLPPDKIDDGDKVKRKSGGDGGGGKDHPLIEGLLVTLPDPGTEWNVEGRKAWLKMAASIFGMIYKKPSTDSTGGNRDTIDLDKLVGEDENGD
jgi:hypothetical protein